MGKFPESQLSRWEKIQLNHTSRGVSSSKWNKQSIKEEKPETVAWRFMVEQTIRLLSSVIEKNGSIKKEDAALIIDQLLAIWPEDKAKMMGLWIIDQYNAAMEQIVLDFDARMDEANAPNPAA